MHHHQNRMNSKQLLLLKVKAEGERKRPGTRHLNTIGIMDNILAGKSIVQCFGNSYIW